MMKMAVVVLGTLVVLIAGGMAYIRLSPMDPARWHADPTRIVDPATPNFARAERLLPMPPDAVAARLAALARTEGARELARSGEVVSYVQRSRLMGYPDVINIRLSAEGEGTRVTALSRSRFGHGDMGVNAARLTRWMAALGT